MFYIKFYEDGAFCTVVGQPEETRNRAETRLLQLCLAMNRQGFSTYPDDFDHPTCFTYDRHGTTCTVRIEED